MRPKLQRLMANLVTQEAQEELVFQWEMFIFLGL